MVSLQQTKLTSFSEDCRAVSFLRRACTLLAFNEGEYTFYIYRQSDTGTWKRYGRCSIPKADRIIGFFALESFYYFLILSERNGKVEATFLDVNGTHLNTVVLTNCSGIRHADFDQKRKELLLVSKRCDVKSYAVRLVVATLKGGDAESSFHVIYRAQTHILDSLSSISVQIVSQDSCGCLLVLLESGSISCFDTSTLQLIWHIDNGRFVVKPTRLHADKFSPGFLIYCDSQNQGGHLEFWTPPSEFQQIHSSLFERYIIPLRSAPGQIHIESIGADYDTSIIIIDDNRDVHLWIFQWDRKQLVFQSSLILNGSERCFSAFRSSSLISNTLNQFGVNNGLGSFLSATGLPGCEVTYIGFSGNGCCTLALHAPCLSDKYWKSINQQQLLLDYSTTTQVAFSQYDEIQDYLSPTRSKLGSNQPHLSAPSLVTMNDSITAADDGREKELIKRDHQITTRDPEASVLFFLPVVWLPRVFQTSTNLVKDSVFQVVYPSGLVFHGLSSDNNTSQTTLSSTDIRRVSRFGLFPTSSTIPSSSSLRFKIVDIACRSSMLVLITDMKEAYVFNLDSSSESKSEICRPIRLELDIRPQAHVTKLMVSDIFIRINSNLVNGLDQFQGNEAIGTHILSMVGDSDGYINFSVCSRSAVLHQGCIRAHNSPIISIHCTGDSSRNLWTIGTTLRSGSSRQVQPKSCPGSAVVSLSKEGELKVWQPIFSQQSSARSDPFQILSIYQLSWKISGLIVVLTRPRNDESSSLNTITSSILDPSCLSCIVGTSNGALTQWPLPGLVSKSNGKVEVAKSCVWNSHKHFNSILHSSQWINLPSTSVNMMSFDQISKETKKLCNFVYDNTSIDPKEACHIGYTVDELRRIAENTLLAVSSQDRSVSLWRFIISKSVEIPEFSDVVVKRTLNNFKYLNPVHCRRITLSFSPELSFCYPLVNKSSSTWRISSLVNGIVIHIAEEPKTSLFSNCEDPQDQFSVQPEHEFHSGDLVDSLSVSCNVHKPLLLGEYSSKYGVHSKFSWDIYNEWQNEYLLFPQVEQHDIEDRESDPQNTLANRLSNGSPTKSMNPYFVEVPEQVNKVIELQTKQEDIPSQKSEGNREVVSIFRNGVYMKVPKSEVPMLESEKGGLKTSKKKYVVLKDKNRLPTAKPTETARPQNMLDQDNLTESSGIVLSVQTPIPRCAPSLSEIDTSGFAMFDFEIPRENSAELATEIALAMSDDISSEASSMNFRLEYSDDSMKLDREKLEKGLGTLATKKIRSVGLATKAFKGTLGASLRQPYRNAAISVPLPSKLKEIYEPQTQRFLANPAKANERRTTSSNEGVSVYRTPASKQEVSELNHFFDGGLEKVPNSDILNSDHSKFLTFLQNPSSHFERLSSPVYYRMTSREKLLQRKQSSQQCDFDSLTEEQSDDDDDDFSFTSELSGDLSSPSQIEAAKSLMGESEKLMYDSMSEAEKMEFLLKKKEENMRIIRDSRKAFQSLLSNPASVQSFPNMASEELTSTIEQSSGTSVTDSEPHQNTVSVQKVLNWEKVEEATNAGVSQSQINDILQKTISKKRKNLADMRFNLTQFTRFAKELNRALIETQYPPEVKVLVTDTRSFTCDVSIESTKFGIAHIIILKNLKDVPKASDFDDLETLSYRYPGVSQIISKTIHEKTTIEFTVKGLQPQTTYALYCCAQHDNNDRKKVIRATDEMIAATITRFRTEEPPPEVLDLEWNRLKPIDQYDELAAVIFDLDTQEKARAQGLRIPTIDSLEKWLDCVESGDLSGNESDGSHDSTDIQMKDVKDFVNWWTGDEYGFSEVRTDFLKREAIFVCADGESIEKCEDEGFLTLAQSATLSSLVNSEDRSELLRSEEFIRFRSWLKGGRVIQDILDKKRNEKMEKRLEKKRAKLLAKEAKILAAKLKQSSDIDSDGEMETENANSIDLPRERPDEVEVEDTIDDAESEESETEDDDPIAVRIAERSQRLQERSSHVEDAIKAIANLHMAYRHGHADGFSVRDLELKRGQLRMESITVIMAMKKLEELCVAKNIAVKDLNEEMYQAISGASTFIEIPEDSLKAEMPPHATLLTLLGQDKRPLRGWDKCSSYEKELELQLAAMISTILELAVEAGVSVPNIEDPYVISGPNCQIGRKLRWDAFEKWYVGNELHENQLKAMPTVARIMFTDWEKKHVKDDVKLREIIKSCQTETPQPPPSNKKKIAQAPTPPVKPIKRMATGDLALTVGKSALDDDEIVKLYEIEVNKPGGDVFRCDILKKQVRSVLVSRNLSMMRLFWPPSGLSRPTSQYLFPRLGLIHPKYEEPVKRFQAFPSKSSETYSIEEVMAWYRSADLKEDDEINVRNELEGQKHQAYLNWLAEEEERMERGRLLMVDEDILSAKLRIHAKGIEVDRELPLGKPRYRDFVFGRRLPGQYEDLKTTTVKFPDGSGLDNEDEVQDILEKMAKETELSLQHARELKKKQVEDRKRKEEEDRIKQEKLERDQRIEENKDRLKKIREHLENIKLQRKLEEEAKQREIEENARRLEQDLILQHEYLLYQENIKRENNLMEQERKFMEQEDMYHHYCREKSYNHENMLLEDELGSHRRAVESKRLLDYQIRLKELEEIYQEYVPFKFDTKKIRNKQFHNPSEGSDDYYIDDEIYDEIDILLKEKDISLSSRQINWRLFAREPLHCGDNNISDKMETFAQRLSPVQYIPKAPLEKKIWPRSENPDISPPLIWSGPSSSMEKKYAKLRKKSRPYTPLNPGEELYTNPDFPEPLEILLPQNEIVGHLEHIGMPKSMVKSIKNSRSLPALASPVLHLHPSHSQKRKKIQVSPRKFQQPSFLAPIRYQSQTEDLRILSPSQELISHKQHDVEPLQKVQQSNSFSDPLLISQDQINVIHGNKKHGKSSDQLIEQIKSDREALRAFIASSSSAMADDRFYLEACRPGLRSRDSISSNQLIQNYRQSLLQSFKNKDHYSGSAIISAVKESIDIVDKVSSSLPMSDSMSATLNQSIIPSDSQKPRLLSAPPSPSSSHTIDRSIPLSDETSVENNQRVSFHAGSPSDVKISLEQHEILHANIRQPPFEPPFSKGLFGVKGQKKVLAEVSPAYVANDIASSKLHGNGIMRSETHKSKQRDEYSSILRKTIETNRKNYSATDVNFINNKGL